MLKDSEEMNPNEKRSKMSKDSKDSKGIRHEAEIS